MLAYFILANFLINPSFSQGCFKGYSEHEGYCYKLIPSAALTPFNARDVCSSRNMEIVKADDETRKVLADMIFKFKNHQNSKVCLVDNKEDKKYGYEREPPYMHYLNKPILGYEKGREVMTEPLKLGDVIHMKIQLNTSKMDMIELGEDLSKFASGTNAVPIVFQISFYNEYHNPFSSHLKTEIHYRYGELKLDSDNQPIVDSKWHVLVWDRLSLPRNGDSFNFRIRLNEYPVLETDLFDEPIVLEHKLSIAYVPHYFTLFYQNIHISELRFERDYCHIMDSPDGVSCNWQLSSGLIPVKRCVQPTFVACRKSLNETTGSIFLIQHGVTMISVMMGIGTILILSTIGCLVGFFKT